MHIHTVYFWLQDGLNKAQLEEFEQGIQSLVGIPHLQRGYWGKPAGTPRDVVDNSYTYSLTFFFETTANHDTYQIDEVHEVFVAKNKAKWKRVQVYDALTNE
jgi:Stress responsive A/B Barrel Domain